MSVMKGGSGDGDALYDGDLRKGYPSSRQGISLRMVTASESATASHANMRSIVEATDVLDPSTQKVRVAQAIASSEFGSFGLRGAAPIDLFSVLPMLQDDRAG